MGDRNYRLTLVPPAPQGIVGADQSRWQSFGLPGSRSRTAAVAVAGTAANYFPRRENLLAAAAERVAELHMAEMAATDRAAVVAADAAAGPDALAELIGTSLHDAVTRHRTRYLAAYELALESTRQPALAEEMARIGTGALDITIAEHRALGLPATPEQAQSLIALYNGTLLSLLVAPPATVTPEAATALARCLVTGVLGSGRELRGHERGSQR